LKFLFGSAFRAPNFFERGFADPLNPLLKPETISSYEVVYDQGLSDHVRSSISAFYNQIDDLITVPLGGYATNINGAEAKGIELELAGSWRDSVYSCISYTFQNTEDIQTHQILMDSPKHLGKFRLSVPVFRNKLFLSAEYQYTSSRTTLFGGRASGYGTLNLNLFTQNLAKGLDISIGVSNLFDRKYYDPATTVPYHVQDLIEHDGRIFHLKMGYRF
jgi:iron complex outermembrane receptor protein